MWKVKLKYLLRWWDKNLEFWAKIWTGGTNWEHINIEKQNTGTNAILARAYKAKRRSWTLVRQHPFRGQAGKPAQRLRKGSGVGLGGKQETATSRNPRVSRRMEWLIMFLHAAWRLHKDRKVSTGFDNKKAVSGLWKINLVWKPNDTMWKSKWEVTNWKQCTDDSLKNSGYGMVKWVRAVFSFVWKMRETLEYVCKGMT